MVAPRLMKCGLGARRGQYIAMSGLSPCPWQAGSTKSRNEGVYGSWAAILQHLLSHVLTASLQPSRAS